MITVAAIHAKVEAAIAAQESGDYAAALSGLRSAKAMIAVLPDSEQGGRGGESLKWRGAELDALIADLRRARAASGGIGITRTRYAAEGQEGDFA